MRPAGPADYSWRSSPKPRGSSLTWRCAGAACYRARLSPGLGFGLPVGVAAVGPAVGDARSGILLREVGGGAPQRPRGCSNPAVGDDEFPSRHQSPPSSALARWDAGRTKKTAMGGMTVQPNEITEVLNRPISQELLARDLTRLAYVAKDGTPRNVPLGFTWNGSGIATCTATNPPKLPALRKNPTVALTIDTDVHPPKILIIRGRAELDVVAGIPDEYLPASGT